MKQRQFDDFVRNQSKLIEILNCRMTGIEQSMISIKTDVSWLKKLLWIIVGLIGAIFTSTLIKLIGG